MYQLLLSLPGSDRLPPSLLCGLEELLMPTKLALNPLLPLWGWVGGALECPSKLSSRPPAMYQPLSLLGWLGKASNLPLLEKRGHEETLKLGS
jgi:hypothetical protein